MSANSPNDPTALGNPSAPESPSIPDNPSERYRRLVDHSPDAICVHENGVVVYVNPAGVRGIAADGPQDIVGRSILDFVHPDSIPSMLERIVALVDEGDSSDPSEATLVRMDGSEFLVEAVSVRTEWEGRPAYEVIFRDLTSQRYAESALRFQAALVEHVSDAIIATTADGVVTSWNPAAATIYQRAAASAIGMKVGDAVGAALDPAAMIAAGGETSAAHRSSDGAVRRMRVSAAPMDDGYVLICSDHTALLRAEQHFRTVVSSLDEGIIVIDHSGEVESVNPAALRIMGLAAEAFATMNALRGYDYPLHDATGAVLDVNDHPVVRTLTTGQPVSGFVVRTIRGDDGRTVWLSGSCRPIDPHDLAQSSVVLSFTDITAERAAAAKLEYRATHDALTGLPNRGHVVARIADELACEDPAHAAAVLFIDLDKLKSINDSLGHSAGDEVLKIVGERLRRAVRRDDVVGRLGGDEFVALLRDGIDRTDVDGLAARLHVALQQPATVDGAVVTLGASIGAVLFKAGDGRFADEILREADDAMYEAKLDGGGRTRHYTGETRQRVGRRASSR